MKSIFELSRKNIKVKGTQSKYELSLSINGEYFNIDNQDLAIKLHPILINKYWNLITRLIQKESKILLKLNTQWARFKFCETMIAIKENNSSQIKNFNLRVCQIPYADGSSEESSTLVLKCDYDEIFKKLFNLYWLNPYEDEMEILVFDKSAFVDFDSLMYSSRFRHEKLKLKFNNLRNGFHFRIINYGEELNLPEDPCKLYS